jgi:C1A family cysteine protease
MFRLNMKESSFDDRDYVYENKVKYKIVNTKICDYRNDLQPIRNQGDQGTCYAQTAACVKEWQEKKDSGFNGYFSPQFFYNNRDYYNDGINDNIENKEDDGMTGRDVMRILKNIGICKEIDYPYGKTDRINEIEENIKKKAYKNRIKSYARINTLEGLKTSLVKNGPCLIAMPVYNYGDQIWIKEKNQEILGGHAMTVVGYNEDSFIIRNSWGGQWGDKGYSYYYFKDWGVHYEIWTTIDLKSEKDIDINNRINNTLKKKYNKKKEKKYTCNCTIF